MTIQVAIWYKNNGNKHHATTSLKGRYMTNCTLKRYSMLDARNEAVVKTRQAKPRREEKRLPIVKLKQYKPAYCQECRAWHLEVHIVVKQNKPEDPIKCQELSFTLS